MMMIANATNVVMQLNHAREITDKNQAPMIWNIVSDMAMIAKYQCHVSLLSRTNLQTRLRQEVLQKKQPWRSQQGFRTVES